MRSSICGMPYGDQGLFLARSLFERLGGYADIPIMEDVDMVRRCRMAGRVQLAAAAITISARRWEREGWMWTTIRNWALVSLYGAGVSPNRLAKWYPPRA